MHFSLKFILAVGMIAVLTHSFRIETESDPADSKTITKRDANINGGGGGGGGAYNYQRPSGGSFNSLGSGSKGPSSSYLPPSGSPQRQQQPSSRYGAPPPSSSYGAPSSQPSSSYNAPQRQYGAPGGGFAPGGRPGGPAGGGGGGMMGASFMRQSSPFYSYSVMLD